MIKFLSNFIFVILLGFCLLWLHQHSGLAQFEIGDWRITTAFSIFCTLLLLTLIGLFLLWHALQFCTKKLVKLLHQEKKKHLESLRQAYYLFFANDLQKCEAELANLNLNYNPDFQLLDLKLHADKKNYVHKLEKLLQHKKLKTAALIMLVRHFYEEGNWEKTSHFLAVLQAANYVIDNKSALFFVKIEVWLHEKKFMLAKESLQLEIENENDNPRTFELFARTTQALAQDFLAQNEGKLALEEIKQTIHFDDSPAVLQTHYEILVQNEEREKIFPIVAMIYARQLEIDEQKALKTAEFALELCFSALERRDLVADLAKLDENSYVGYYLQYRILLEEGDREGAFAQLQIAIEKNEDEQFLLTEGLKLGFELQKNDFCQHILQKIAPTKNEIAGMY